MSVFSERNKLEKTRDIQIKSIDISLFNRIFNIFYNREFISIYDAFSPGISRVEKILDSFGATYEYPDNYFDVNNNIKKLKTYLNAMPWYKTYDFIEIYISLYNKATDRNKLEKEFNVVLEKEKSGYRIIKGMVVPITNPEELKSLEISMSTEFDSVNLHFQKALAFYSDRESPDYENSVKESISAVEAMCCIITGMSGAQATLGAAIKKLKSNGIHIHSAMEKAFLALYGYTSDEKGIRHGGIDFVEVPPEDAKYMLISCSAFVNYLIEKYSKIQ